MLTLKEYLSEGTISSKSNYKKVLIAPGKFSIAHLGHKEIIKKLAVESRNLNVQGILLIIDTGKLSRQKPLSGEERKIYIENKLLNGYPDIKVHVASNAYSALKELADNNILVIGEVVGSDRSGVYKELSSRIYKNFDENNFKTFVVERNTNKSNSGWISSSKIRELISEGNFSAFCTSTGLNGLKAKNMFSLIKSRIETL